MLVASLLPASNLLEFLFLARFIQRLFLRLVEILLLRFLPSSVVLDLLSPDLLRFSLHPRLLEFCFDALTSGDLVFFHDSDGGVVNDFALELLEVGVVGEGGGGEGSLGGGRKTRGGGRLRGEAAVGLVTGGRWEAVGGVSEWSEGSRRLFEKVGVVVECNTIASKGQASSPASDGRSQAYNPFPRAVMVMNDTVRGSDVARTPLCSGMLTFSSPGEPLY